MARSKPHANAPKHRGSWTGTIRLGPLATEVRLLPAAESGEPPITSSWIAGTDRKAKMVHVDCDRRPDPGDTVTVVATSRAHEASRGVFVPLNDEIWPPTVASEDVDVMRVVDLGVIPVTAWSGTSYCACPTSPRDPVYASLVEILQGRAGLLEIVTRARSRPKLFALTPCAHFLALCSLSWPEHLRPFKDVKVARPTEKMTELARVAVDSVETGGLEKIHDTHGRKLGKVLDKLAKAKAREIEAELSAQMGEEIERLRALLPDADDVELESKAMAEAHGRARKAGKFAR